MVRKWTYEDLEKRIKELEKRILKARKAEGGVRIKDSAIESSIQDITDRKRAEQALRESEEKYSAVVQQAKDGVLIIQDGILQFVNKALADILGYATGEMENTSYINYVAPESRTMVAARVEARLTGQDVPQVYEAKLVRKDGTILDAELSASVIHHRGKPADVGIVRIITERKRVEDALRQERETFSTILENDPHGIALLNKEGEYLYVNPQFTRITGYTLEDTPTGREWFRKAHPDPAYRKTAIEAWKRHSMREERGADVEFKITRKDGLVKDVEFRTTFLKDRSITVLTDVTQRNQSEAALRESEEYLNNLVNSIHAGIIVVDAEKHEIADVNPLAVQLTGIPKDKLIGRVCHEFICPAERGKCPITDLKQSVDNAERVLLKPNGEKIPILKTVVPITRKGRKYLVESFLDIAEGKRAEEALRDREKEAKRLAQENAAMAEIASIINSSLDIEEVYERFAEEVRKLIPFDRISINLVNLKDNATSLAYVTGLDIQGRLKGDSVSLTGSFSKHIISTRKSLLVPTEELKDCTQRFPALVPTLQAGVRSLMSIPLISKDEVIGILHFRSTKPNSYSEKELRLAERVGYHITSAIANSQLFAEHKRTEAALLDSEKKFRDLYDNAPVGYHEYDIGGRITQVNQTDLDMLGYEREERLGEFVWKFNVEEQAREQILAKLAGTLPAGRELERTYRRKDGTTIPVLIEDRLIRDDQGRITGIRCTIQNITERKRAEEEKERLQAQLQRAQKMEAIGTLAGGVAHDLNNVLSGIVSYPDLLLMQVPGDSPLRKPLATIRESGKRAAAIVQDLLTLARRGVAAPEVVALNEVISEYLHSPEHESLRLFHPDVQVETRLDTDLLNILGSPVHLSKTVMNLISNAAESMPGGGQGPCIHREQIY